MDMSPTEASLPGVEEQQLANLIFNIKDWQITHGMLLKYGPDAENVHSLPIGVSMFPTPFPRQLFEEAQKLQTSYNRLYMSISEDEAWLYDVLRGHIDDDGSLAATLWSIHQEVKQEGYIQPNTLGIFRSDYMVHDNGSTQCEPSLGFGLRQVEFNTYSVAGGAHSNNAAEMHRYMEETGAYSLAGPESRSRSPAHHGLPPNDTIRSLANAIWKAHSIYRSPQTEQRTTPGVLFIVQPRNMNICDERPLEYALWNHNPSIPAYRVIFGEEVLTNTYLSPTRELMYQSPSMSSPLEIAVVYMRAGYELEEYTPSGYAARLLLEKSRAIKCPSILCHLATFKKVQQELAVPGVLERFLPATDAAAIAKTFMPMYPMDNLSSAGKQGRRLACDPVTAAKHVLKPSLEGGGHNIYSVDIPAYLGSIPKSQWHSFILMELISPPVQKSVLLPPGGMSHGAHPEATNPSASSSTFHPDPITSTSKNLIDRFGEPTASELGIFGTCIWRRQSGENGGSLVVLENSDAGWSFKTKPAGINEMSVVKGYGCFDSPLLIDMNAL